ncbi:hypothetical protein MNBD_GAMMA16-1570 [hydrothermal vent metagenome]|uniref:Uncharacterized protein n=1 Tax=hydrothermal vent metagenome TaxID=652676 RepID=A0A3B0ZWD6_9ZZZZ
MPHYQCDINPEAIADRYTDKSISSTEAVAIAEHDFVEEAFSFDEEDEMDMSMAGMNHSKMNMSGIDHASAASGDDTLSPQILAQVSHAHLLSFALLLLPMGGLLCLTQLTESIKPN